MKRFALTISILCAATALSYAGTETYSGKDKEVIQQAPAPCEWYRAHEWDFNFWASISMPYNSGRRENSRHGDFDTGPDVGAGSEIKNLGAAGNDRFINRDSAWGGGLDIKYFWNKHWAIGGEGFVVDADKNAAGGGFATLTFRWPIGCSRFAPYTWAGVGAASGGSRTIHTFVEAHHPNGIETEGHKDTTLLNKQTDAAGQFGAGLEVRLTHRVGLTGDYSYNVLQNGNNDFGMARFGLMLTY